MVKDCIGYRTAKNEVEFPDHNLSFVNKRFDDFWNHAAKDIEKEHPVQRFPSFGREI